MARSKLVLLGASGVLLLGACAWGVTAWSQAQQQELRAAQIEAAQKARLARIAAPLPTSALPLDPYARRAAMAAALRLRPDQRFLRAAEAIAELTFPGKAPAAEARFEAGKWKLALGEEALGEVPELPDYPDLMEPLVALARRRLAGAPLAPPVAPLPAGVLPLPEAEARTALPAELSRWRGGQRTAAALHQAALAASSLFLYQIDYLEVGDALAAQAIALSALDAATGQAQTDAEQGLLASTLGYGAAARQLGARLPGEGALKLYLLGDDARLAESARLREARPADRYLQLRRLLSREGADAADRFVESDLGPDGLELPVLARLLGEPKTGYLPAAFQILLLAAAEGVPFDVAVQDSHARTLAFAAGSAIVRLGLRKGELSTRLDAALAKQDVVVAGYLRALWLSALRRQGDDLTEHLASTEAAAEFAEMLTRDTSPTVQTFRRWFDARAALLSRDVGAALAFAAEANDLGAGALAELLTTASKRADYGDPRISRAVRALAPRLDARPSQRLDLGVLAWDGLRDVGACARLMRSAFRADPEGHEGVRSWFARLSGDARILAEMGRDKSARRGTRIEAWKDLWEVDPTRAGEAERGLRALIDEDPADVQAALALGKRLARAGRLEEGRTVLSAWLQKHDASDLESANVRAEISRNWFLAGRHEEGLEAVRPALPIYNEPSLAAAALNLAGAGRAEQARKMSAAMVERYPFPNAATSAAEVEWLLGDLDAAAQRLVGSQTPVTALDYMEKVGEPFARLFGDQPERAAAAAAALGKAGVDATRLRALASEVEALGHPEAAFRIVDAIPARNPGQADFDHLIASRHLRKARGDAQARAYLARAFPSIPPLRGRNLALMAFQGEVQDAVWDLVPDPPGTDDAAETVWMLRAAEVALRGPRAPGERVKALRAHYAAVGAAAPARHVQIGRFLLGDLPEAEVARLVTDEEGTCEVPYYLGVRAEGEKRAREAWEWYEVAVECGRRSEAEYLFAFGELTHWRKHAALFRDPL